MVVLERRESARLPRAGSRTCPGAGSGCRPRPGSGCTWPVAASPRTAWPARRGARSGGMGRRRRGSRTIRRSIRRPSRCGRMPRRVVSTSGSSGNSGPPRTGRVGAPAIARGRLHARPAPGQMPCGAAGPAPGSHRVRPGSASGAKGSTPNPAGGSLPGSAPNPPRLRPLFRLIGAEPHRRAVRPAGHPPPPARPGAAAGANGSAVPESGARGRTSARPGTRRQRRLVATSAGVGGRRGPIDRGGVQFQQHAIGQDIAQLEIRSAPAAPIRARPGSAGRGRPRT